MWEMNLGRPYMTPAQRKNNRLKQDDVYSRRMWWTPQGITL